MLQKTLFPYLKEEKILTILLFLLPISIVSGPFIPDLIIVTISSYFLFCLVKKKMTLIYNKQLFYVVISFWIMCLVLSLISEYKLHSLKSSFLYVRFILFAFALSYFLTKYPNIINKFFFSITLIFSLVIVDACIQKIFGVNSLGLTMSVQYNDKISGFFGDEHVLGSYLIRLTPVIAACFFFKINFKLKKYFVIFYLPIILTIFFSGERTAFVFSILFIIFYIFFIDNKFSLLKKSFILILFFSILMSLNLFAGKQSYRMINAPLGEMFNSIDERGERIGIIIISSNHQKIYETTLNMIKNNFIFGIGPNNFRNYCKKKEYFVDGKEVCNTHPHQTILQLSAETGLVGMAISIIVITFLIIVFIKQFFLVTFFKKSKYTDSFMILAFGMLIIFSPFSPNGNFFNNWISTINSIISGLAIYFYNNSINTLKK